MGCKLRLNIIIFLIITVVLFNGCKKQLPSSGDYCRKLYDSLTETGQVQLKDIFDFEFDRVYFINENYMDGEMFSDQYDLNLDIPQVKENVREEVRRAVFVDKNGKFIYEFRYEYADKLLPYREGIVAYPETKLRLAGLRSGDVKIFEAVGAKSFL